MKKKYLAAIVGVMMAATSVTAYGAATTDRILLLSYARHCVSVLFPQATSHATSAV